MKGKMMQKEQPEALRLADEISSVRAPYCGAAASELRRLHDELKECQDQRRAAFRRIEELDRELDAMRAQIGHGVPEWWLLIATDAYEAGYGNGLNAKQTGRETENPWVDEPGRGAWAIGYELAKERASTHPAPQQKPLTDGQQIAEALRKHGFALVKTAAGYDVIKLGPCVAHNIGEKK